MSTSRPIEQRLHAHVFAFRSRCCELSPEFRRLILVIPFRLRVARRKIALLRPGRIFIAANSGDERVPLVLGDRLLQRDRFQLVRHRHRIMRLVTDTARAGLLVDLNDEIEFVMRRRPFAKLEHLRKFISRIDVQNRKRNLSEKRFACEPDEDVRVLPHRPRHGDVLERVIGLAKNKDALVLQLIEMCAVVLVIAVFCERVYTIRKA